VSPNSWLAVDAGTTPKVRAQELRFAWERFMADDDDEDPGIVREAIADSWRRSSAAGVDPTGARRAPIVADEGETHERFLEHPLGGVVPLIREGLSAIADEAGYLIVVSDANGMLMTIEGSAGVRLRAAGDMNFAEGTLWSEGGAGTNAIGTAIAVDHAVQVFGPADREIAYDGWQPETAESGHHQH
jgi:transcriptional regulator of acetoin/glycerol metabolism